MAKNFQSVLKAEQNKFKNSATVNELKNVSRELGRLNDLKERELKLKERELQLKEYEAELKRKQLNFILKKGGNVHV